MWRRETMEFAHVRFATDVRAVKGRDGLTYAGGGVVVVAAAAATFGAAGLALFGVDGGGGGCHNRVLR